MNIRNEHWGVPLFKTDQKPDVSYCQMRPAREWGQTGGLGCCQIGAEPDGGRGGAR